MRRRAVGLLMSVGVLVAMIGPLAPVAQAVEYCRRYPVTPTPGEVTPLDTVDCVSRDAQKGYRGTVEFYTQNNNPFPAAGRFHVELTRNGNHKANSVEWVNPTISACQYWQSCVPEILNTPWVDGNSGRWCSILWFSWGGDYFDIERKCRDF